MRAKHVALGALIAAAAAAERVEVPFSYAWRFHLGPGPDDGPGPGNGWAFPQLISNCTGTWPNPNRITSLDCSVACAYNPSCMVWIHVNNSRSCAHGDGNATCVPAVSNATANGALRTTVTPLQTSYAFAAALLPEDAGWPLVDAPHDALMSLNNSFSETGGDASHGYRVRQVVWYRKHFQLPGNWAGSHVLLRFEGVGHVAQVWLNGEYLLTHNSEYGGFTVRLDNISAAVWGGPNVLALRADASWGSAHWYSGGGIDRPVWLVRTAAANIVEDGVFAPAELATGATSAFVSAEWQNSGGAAGGSITCAVLFQLQNASTGEVLSNVTTPPATLPPSDGIATTATAQLPLPPSVLAHLWSIQAPTLYTLNVTLLLLPNGGGQEAVDGALVTVGYRTTRWDPATGFYLNDAPVRQRGFSNHNSFAGVGVAMPPRLDVFRAQVARALGANTWRMSHNPYRSSLYDALDALGIMVRDFDMYTASLSLFHVSS